MAVEVVLLIPVLMAFVLLIVAFGRYIAVRGDIEATARDAARQASLQSSPEAARAAAQASVNASLEDDTTCGPVDFGGRWQAGGEVIIRLDCEVSWEGLGLIGLSGTKDLDAESSVPLDPYRSFG